MNIKQAAEQSGVSARNIRYYEQAGLLTPARNPENEYRVYSQADVRALKLIRMLRTLDMPVEEIGTVLNGTLPLAEAAERQRQRLERLHRPLRQESGFQACDEREHGTACFRSGWGGKDCLQPYGLYSRFGSRTAGSDKGPSVKCDLRRGALSCLHCPAVVCCGIFFVSVKKISILCNKTAG